MGNGTLRFVTLYAIETHFLTEPVVKLLKFKVGHLTLSLKKLFTFQNAVYVEKLPMFLQNLEQHLIIIKVHTDPKEKTTKYHRNVFRNILGNTVIKELMIGY